MLFLAESANENTIFLTLSIRPKGMYDKSVVSTSGRFSLYTIIRTPKVHQPLNRDTLAATVV